MANQAHKTTEKPPLTILLAGPRGFCAGVVRAIDIVEKALEKFGPPVYVRHEIVHNKFVVEDLKSKGAIFVKELDEIPDTDAPVVFSAHGVPKSVPAEAKRRKFFYVDATCPLVSKVHREAERHHKDGYEIILIGHQGHPEVIGTIGQLPNGAIHLVETISDVDNLIVQNPDKLAHATQTTLSVDETKDILDALQKRFPNIKGPKKEDICYATTNRQSAVKVIAPQIDGFLVVGSENSSNSNRLVDTAKTHNAPKASLVPDPNIFDLNWLDGMTKIGISSGASVPDHLVDTLIGHIKTKFDVTIEDTVITKEDITFKLPKAITA